MFVGLELTGANTSDPNATDHYTLNVRKGILEVNPPGASNEAFVIHTDIMTWKNLVLYKVAPEDAIADGIVVVSGGVAQDFYDFMNLFDFAE
jgi:hypothetical protein